MKKQSDPRTEFAMLLHENYARRHPLKLDRTECYAFLWDTLQIIFPHFRSDRTRLSPRSIVSSLKALEKSLQQLLSGLSDLLTENPSKYAESFISTLPQIYQALLLDAEAIYNGDPAAHSVDEVILAYPGFLAISVYRLAAQLHRQSIPVLPRVLTEYAHRLTGIDIHPGAEIGASFFIDHGTGIVIGETTIIKKHVKVYQGVTLGALSVNKSQANSKRHPTIESNVVIYSNATILGGSTVVGQGSTIGGNVWLTKSVPVGSTVYHDSVVTVKPSRKK